MSWLSEWLKSANPFQPLIDAVKRQGMTIAIGEEGKVYVPGADELNALVVRGEMGARWRIIGVVVRREK